MASIGAVSSSQFSQVLVLKFAQAAFGVACFWGFSDIYKCLGHLQMAPSPLDKQTASCDLSHDWLMSLAMDLAALYNMYTVLYCKQKYREYNSDHISATVLLYISPKKIFKS